MQIDRLLAGAAVATLMATSAFAQSGSTPSSTAMPPAATDQAPSAATPDAAASAPAAQTIITPSPTSDIVAEMKSAGQFNTLVALLTQDGLASLVQAQPNITLIAPTDAAFAALPPGELDALKKDPAQLRALLTYHLIAAKVTEDQVKGHAAGKVMTAASKAVTIDGSVTPIKINDATVLQTAIASNGVVFVVDKVLTPAA
ncbi:MAG: fasciclin domain-containing protein [Caulobacteraceae bacterium]